MINMNKIKEKVEELSEEEKTNLIIDLFIIAGFDDYSKEMEHLLNEKYRKILLKQMGVK